MATTARQLPEAAIVLVTVYVPAKLDAKLTNPVTGFIVRPAGEDVNVPATPPPENVGEGLVPF